MAAASVTRTASSSQVAVQRLRTSCWLVSRSRCRALARALVADSQMRAMRDQPRPLQHRRQGRRCGRARPSARDFGRRRGWSARSARRPASLDRASAGSCRWRRPPRPGSRRRRRSRRARPCTMKPQIGPAHAVRRVDRRRSGVSVVGRAPGTPGAPRRPSRRRCRRRRPRRSGPRPRPGPARRCGRSARPR